MDTERFSPAAPDTVNPDTETVKRARSRMIAFRSRLHLSSAAVDRFVAALFSGGLGTGLGLLLV